MGILSEYQFAFCKKIFCPTLRKDVIVLFIEPLLSNIKRALMKTKSESLLFYFSINLDNTFDTLAFVLGALF